MPTLVPSAGYLGGGLGLRAEMVYPADSTAYPADGRPVLKSMEEYLRQERFDPLQAPRTRAILKTPSRSWAASEEVVSPLWGW